MQYRLLGKGIEDLSHSGQQQFKLIYTCQYCVCVYKCSMYLINGVLYKYSLPSIFPINEYMPSNMQYNTCSVTDSIQKLQKRANKTL